MENSRILFIIILKIELEQAALRSALAAKEGLLENERRCHRLEKHLRNQYKEHLAQVQVPRQT